MPPNTVDPSSSDPNLPPDPLIPFSSIDPLYGQTVTFFNDSLIFLGGSVTPTNAKNEKIYSLDAYSVFRWRRMENISPSSVFTRTGHTAHLTAQNEILILFGASAINSDPVVIFNPTTKSIKSFKTTNTPSNREFHSSDYDTKRNRVYLYGGKDIASGKILGDCWVLDVSTGVWREISIVKRPSRVVKRQEMDTSMVTYDPFASTPPPLYSHASALVNNYFVTCFGMTRSTSTNRIVNRGNASLSRTETTSVIIPISECWTLNTITEEFTRPTQFNGPLPRSVSTLTTIPNTNSIVSFGGVNSNTGYYFDDTFMLDTSSLPTQLSWQKLSTTGYAPSPRGDHSAIIINKNKLVLWGGTGFFSGTNISNHIYVLDLNSNIWLERYDPGSDRNTGPDINSAAFWSGIVLGLVAFLGMMGILFMMLFRYIRKRSGEFVDAGLDKPSSSSKKQNTSKTERVWFWISCGLVDHIWFPWFGKGVEGQGKVMDKSGKHYRLETTDSVRNRYKWGDGMVQTSSKQPPVDLLTGPGTTPPMGRMTLPPLSATRNPFDDPAFIVSVPEMSMSKDTSRRNSAFVIQNLSADEEVYLHTGGSLPRRNGNGSVGMGSGDLVTRPRQQTFDSASLKSIQWVARDEEKKVDVDVVVSDSEKRKLSIRN